MGKNDLQIVNGDPDYELLLQSVGEALQNGRKTFVAAANSAMVHSYWEIGQYIIEYEQKGHAKAEYGSDVVNYSDFKCEALSRSSSLDR